MSASSPQNAFHDAQALVLGGVEWLRLVIETLGAIVIAIGLPSPSWVSCATP